MRPITPYTKSVITVSVFCRSTWCTHTKTIDERSVSDYRVTGLFSVPIRVSIPHLFTCDKKSPSIRFVHIRTFHFLTRVVKLNVVTFLYFSVITKPLSPEHWVRCVTFTWRTKLRYSINFVSMNKLICLHTGTTPTHHPHPWPYSEWCGRIWLCPWPFTI